MSSLTRVALLSILLLTVLPALAGAVPHTPAPTGGLVEVIVTFDQPSVARATRNADLRSLAAVSYARRLSSTQRVLASRLTNEVPGMQIQRRYSVVVDGFAVTLPRSELGRLQETEGVAHVYPSVSYRAQRSSSPGFIGATALWGPKLATAGGGMKIGIIDDGIDSTHPYFKPKGYRMPRGFPKGQKRFTTAKVIVARAFAPRTPKYRYANRPFDPVMSEHATHVAGIAAGNYRTPARGSRISGVAPKAYLGNYKVLTIPTPGFGLNGNSPEIVAAIEAAVRDGMDVINLSLGEPEIEPSRDIVALALDAAAAAGVVPVVAAGNDFDDFGRGSVGSPGSAAAAITVGATTSTASPSMASFSSAGPTPISLRLKPDVVAPGTSILSSRPGGWQLSSGTSMAAPHVAGAVALLLQRHPGWTPAQVKAALTATARPLTSSDGGVGPTRAGAGLVDVAAADEPLLRATPTGVSFGLVTAGTTVTRMVTIEDAGGGPAPWATSVELDSAPGGAHVVVGPTVSAPGSLTLTFSAGQDDGEMSGDVLLRRDGVTRRVPFWGRITTPKLDASGARTLLRPGVYAGDTRGRRSLVDVYRYPEVPRGGPVSATLAGPEQVFRVRVGPGF